MRSLCLFGQLGCADENDEPADHEDQHIQHDPQGSEKVGRELPSSGPREEKKVQHIGSRVCAQEKAKQHTDDAVHFLNSGQGVTVIEYSGKCDTCQA